MSPFLHENQCLATITQGATLVTLGHTSTKQWQGHPSFPAISEVFHLEGRFPLLNSHHFRHISRTPPLRYLKVPASYSGDLLQLNQMLH
ncbi:hypothetical protein M413DRAFT_396305 [Hebeloma cylindrosporum]|uniref:Uncharacterized protein n=1 Tax=Hebeloma cylindrosporum TaxID=76867 RepID=A0A0C3C2J0_HEBCY|nr:hypothetical protein M413DRAFT_396305 [Hebeloma cylindrosporum h7]